MQTSETYKTTDLNLAAALFTAGNALIGLDKTDPSNAQFIFDYSTGLDFVASDFWNGTLKLSARAYSENMRIMKNRLHR